MTEIAVFLNALAALAWPTFWFWFAYYFRKEIREWFRRLKRGKFLGQEIELLSPDAATGIRGPLVAVHAKESAMVDELTELQIKILEKFLEKGDYDTLSISANLYPDFMKLKSLGLLHWDTEKAGEDHIAVTGFRLTDDGKKRLGN